MDHRGVLSSARGLIKALFRVPFTSEGLGDLPKTQANGGWRQNYHLCKVVSVTSEPEAEVNGAFLHNLPP